MWLCDQGQKVGGCCFLIERDVRWWWQCYSWQIELTSVYSLEEEVQDRDLIWKEAAKWVAIDRGPKCCSESKHWVIRHCWSSYLIHFAISFSLLLYIQPQRLHICIWYRNTVWTQETNLQMSFQIKLDILYMYKCSQISQPKICAKIRTTRKFVDLGFPSMAKKEFCKSDY